MNLGGLLQGLANIGGILCTFATLVLFAQGKLTDSAGARGEGMMIGRALAAVAFYAAAVFIGTQDLTISA